MAGQSILDQFQNTRNATTYQMERVTATTPAKDKTSISLTIM